MFLLVLISVPSHFCYVLILHNQQEQGNTSRVSVRAFVSMRVGSAMEYELDVYNKIDSISIEQLDKLARQPHSVVISCELDLKFVRFT